MRTRSERRSRTRSWVEENGARRWASRPTRCWTGRSPRTAGATWPRPSACAGEVLARDATEPSAAPAPRRDPLRAQRRRGRDRAVRRGRGRASATIDARQRRLLQQLRERVAARQALRAGRGDPPPDRRRRLARAGTRGTTSARCSRTSSATTRRSRRCGARSRSRPSTVRTTRVLGEVLYHLGRLRSADASLRRCIELGWDTDVNLWTMLGNTQRLLGELPEAIVCLERALELSAGSAAARSNLGDRVRAGRPVRRGDRAPAHVDQARARERHHALERLVRAADRGRDRRGLGRVGVGPPRRRAAASARRTSRAGRPSDTDGRVLCYREQGVGDEILFASCYPDLHRGGERRRDRDRSARRARCSPDRSPTPRCARRRSTSIDGETMHDFDYAIPAGQPPAALPRVARRLSRPRGRSSSPIPSASPRGRRGSPRSGPARYVGMSWRSRVKTAERRLEYTQLDEWGELFAIPGVTGSTSSTTTASASCATAERDFGVHDPPLGLARPHERLRGGRGADDVPRPRRRAAQRGGDARRRARRADRDDGQPLGLVATSVPTRRRGSRRSGSCTAIPSEEWDDVLATAAAAVRDVTADRRRHPKATEETHDARPQRIDDPAHGRHRLVRQRLRRARHALLARRDVARVLARRAEAVGDARPLRRRAGPLPHRRRPRPVPHDARGRRRRHRRARRRDEAGPGVRVQPVRGGAHQRARRAARGRRGDRRPRAPRGRAVDRQGREPGEPLRRDEAVRREDLRAGQRVRRAAPDPARVRALRQRRRLARLGRSGVPRAARARRPHHDHRRAHDPLLDHAPAGRRPRAARARQHGGRRDLRPEDPVDARHRPRRGDRARRAARA